MTINILVVTPTNSFGEMLRKTIEQSGPYRVHVVRSKSEAVVRADEANCTQAFLDLELEEEWVTEIGQALRTVRPGINLFILCDNATPPTLDQIRPWTLVRKPFYLPDVMELIANTDGESAAASEEPILPWLTDATKAAQHLTRLTLESSAQAALITRKNDLWAYAGGLSQGAAKEIAQIVTRNWDGQKGSDLLRFIRLESTKAEHMLYATRLAADVVLAMVFDAETPFSTIRSQASQLVSSLDEERADAQRPTIPLSKQRPSATVNASDDGDDDDLEIPPISDILSDIPSPNPPTGGAWHPEYDLQRGNETPPTPDQTRVSVPLSRATVFSREASPPVPLKNPTTGKQSSGFDQTVASKATMEEINVTAPSRPQMRPETPIRPPSPDELTETRPSPTTEAARNLKLEPITAGLYHLSYACLLIPRFTSHYLTGDMADHLSEWLPTICIAFGWRLEHLAVRPEYLQWVVNVQPNTSPGQLMRIMRQQTSEKIFFDFPRLKKENPSGDFWAPGYLIMGGNQLHPPQLVKDYIHETRERQGMENSRTRR